VAPDVRAGDIVVASEVRGPEGSVVRSPAAPLLAAAIRSLGLESAGPGSPPVRVHLGPVATTDRLALGSRRRMLAAEGVFAVDMESSWLGTLANRPFAVVRVIVDDAETSLYHPATVPRGRAAINLLTRLVPALERWSDAISPRRRVVLASPRSFCAGVERAIEIVELALKQRGAPVYVRKQIVHNEHVVSDLERRGAIFVDELDEVPRGATTVFSAHGVSPAVREAAAARGLDVIDATCPLVSKVHAEARRFAEAGNTILLIGHEGHEEIDGTRGEAPEATLLVQDVRDAERVELPDPERVTYLTQTTLAVDETEEIVETLRERFPALRGPASDDICYATTNRQVAVREVARSSDVMLVVGSATSSNSKRLVEVSEREHTPAYLVDDETDVDLEWIAGAGTVGLSAGASAPEPLVRGVIDAIAALGGADLEEHTTTTESLRFRLPKEVRR
jgi:4-hydroxy-3-methylbut-2-enyl diphosphate reductase